MEYDTAPALGDRSGRTRLPFVVPLLALGTFLMCTTEFMIAGLLAQMADGFGVRPSQIGLLITAFAMGMIVGAPVMAIATLRLPKRATLVLALVIFAGGHVVAALSGSFEILLAARVLTAVVTGAFWSVASVVATTAAGPAASSRALGLMGSGVAFATVLGVPLGSLAGEHLGWRGTFWALAVLAAAAAVVIGRFAPADGHGAAPSVRSELRALRNARLWIVLSATVLVLGGCMATFSYLAPLLTERAGISLGLVPIVFVCFGIGSLIGTNVVGRFADRNQIATFIATAAAAALILLMLIPLSANAVTAVILVTLLGAACMAVPPIATGLSVALAGSAPTLAAAVTVSAFNAGIAAGSSIAGYALNSSLGATGPATVGVVMVTLGLGPLIVLAAKRVRRRPPASEHRRNSRTARVAHAPAMANALETSIKGSTHMSIAHGAESPTEPLVEAGVA
jgi:DHA1 family inner membrane transport protein